MNDKYKMILVDDEDDVRGRILSKIKDSSGFEVVGKAGNGYDALELIEELEPHIVLTDIKMPFINGIELAKIIRREHPMTKVAFISGYDEFDYAREAIDLKVLSYLTKPVTSNDIDVFLKKVKEQLDKESQELKDITSIKEKYDELLPILGDSYLSSLILSPRISDSDIEKLKIYGINIGKGDFITCLLEIDHMSRYSIEETEKYKIRINEVIKNKFKEEAFVYSMIIPDGLVFIIKLDEKVDKEIDHILFEVIKTVEDYLSIDIKIGISEKYQVFNNFPESFKEAKRALGYSQFMNLSRIVYCSELDYRKAPESLSLYEDLFNIEHVIKYGNDRSVEEVIIKIKNSLDNQKDTFASNHNVLVIGFANLYIKLSQDVDPDILGKLASYKTKESFLDFITKIINEIRKKDVKGHVSRTDKILQGTINYIKMNYSDPMLSLENVCEKMNISISHLSMLLKKKKGITFNKFLIKTRLDKAIELLTTTDMKIVDVSIECGYNEVYYFSHSFKKYTGFPPGEYRKSAQV